MKTCSGCHIPKDEDEFHRRPPSEGSRLRSRCKECCRPDPTAKRRYDRRRYLEQGEEIRARVVNYQTNHRAEKREYDVATAQARRDRFNKRFREDPKFRITVLTRNRIKDAIRGKRKFATSAVLLGCSVDELMTHLQSRFTAGMTMALLMAGKIDIDHVVPCAAFDLTDPEQQKACFHFTNLQPLWPRANKSKRDRVSPDLIRPGSPLHRRQALAQ